MYFPYLRGRQFELIALRELLEHDLIGDQVVPIIEPIKPTSTLALTLKKFNEKQKKHVLIMNPEVGDFTKTINEGHNNDDKTAEEIINFVKSDYLIRAYLMKKGTCKWTNTFADGILGKSIGICNGHDCLDEYNQVYSNEKPQYTLILDERRYKRKIDTPKVLLEDHFNKMAKNADYLDCEDEFYSEDHLFYKEEQFAGFSDYSIVGADYSATGFAPLAVAIHIVYFDSRKELRIHHFVSDSNEDINDPAGKFGEALTKLINWMKENDIDHTLGLEGLLKCYEDGTYPGLGSVKKFSIMHHIELMSKYLEGVS